MSLYIERIEFTNFRNYPRFKIKTPENLVIIKGDNALGKTNIIEGIQLITMLSSFRNPLWEEVQLKGQTDSKLQIKFQKDGRELDIKLEITDNKRIYFLNGKRKQISDIQGIIPSVLFTPEDLNIIKGPPDVRRNNIDLLGVQLSRTYAAIKQDYQKIVKQRNILLRDKFSSLMALEAWDQRLVSLGALLFTHRIRLFKRSADRTQETYAQLTEKETFSAQYIPSFIKYLSEGQINNLEKISKEEVEAIIEIALKDIRNEEYARGKTLIGPHRDDIKYLINNNNARTYGSQGQQRTIALALKISEMEIIRQITHSEPVLLLDDVMSELDENRRTALLNTIKPDSYTFITTTNLGYFNKDILSRAQILTLPLESEEQKGIGNKDICRSGDSDEKK